MDSDIDMGNFDHHFERDEKNKDFIFERPREEVRISEVLQHNLLQLDKLSIAQQSTAYRHDNTTDQNDTIHKMQGDIPQLNLHKSFFVGGIRIGWPYPLIMPPQRQMVIHLTKAFKTSRHVVMESPTGTGKSAAILCAALAWQRYHSKVHQGEVTKIIYCSRTHSQVAQMVRLSHHKTLKDATLLTHPDPTHIYHRQVKRFLTHSIRVTSCFILVATNLQEHVIEHHLQRASVG